MKARAISKKRSKRYKNMSKLGVNPKVFCIVSKNGNFSYKEG